MADRAIRVLLLCYPLVRSLLARPPSVFGYAVVVGGATPTLLTSVGMTGNRPAALVRLVTRFAIP